MSNDTYIPHETPPRPFRRGDTVELIDSRGFNCGTLTIAKGGRWRVAVEDGREYVQNDGRWYADGRPWPYPWIRLAQSDKVSL